MLHPSFRKDVDVSSLHFVFKKPHQALGIVSAFELVTSNMQTSTKNRMDEVGLLRWAVDAVKTGIWEWNLEDDSATWDDRMHQIYGVEFGSFQGGWSPGENTAIQKMLNVPAKI